MATNVFNCRQVSLSYEKLLELNKAGQCELGVDTQVAEQMIQNGIRPTKSAVRGAYYFWMFVGFGVFAFSVYLSFSYAWWCFIVGFFIVFGPFAKNLRESNAQNFIKAAGFDRDFYEQVRLRNGWIYQMDEALAEQYRAVR